MALSRAGIINKIDTTLQKLHDVYAAAFATSNKQSTTGATADIGGVFQSFWEMLRSYPEFSSLDQLDLMFENLRNNFEPHIDMFCDALKFPKSAISEDLKKPLKQFIELYCLLLRQRHILCHLDEADTPKSLHHKATEIGLAIEVSKHNIQMDNRLTFVRVEAELATIIFKQACKLGELSYLRSDVSVVAPSQVASSLDEIISFDRLRSISQINTIIERLDLARSKNEEVNYAYEISALRAVIGEIIAVKNLVNAELASRFALFDVAAQQLNEQAAKIDEQINLIRQHERYFQVINLLIAANNAEQMQAAVAQASAACQLQSTLRRLTKGFVAIDDITFGRITSAWHEADKYTTTAMNEIATDISRWLEQYEELTKNFDSVNNDRVEIESLQSRLTEQARVLQAKKISMLNTQLIFDQAYDHVVSTLEEHVNIQFDSSNSAFAYFKRHWWQGLVGGVAGGGGGTGLSFLLILDPTKLSLLITGGVVLGGSLGVGAGTVYDYFFFKPKLKPLISGDLEVNRAPTETDRLLPK